MKVNTLFVGWNRAISGREAMAAELFQGMLGYFGKQQAAGLVESFEPVLLAVHGGDMNGFVIVRGTPENLQKVRTSEDFLQLIIKCGIAVDGFGVIDGFRDDALMQIMQAWGAAATQA